MWKAEGFDVQGMVGRQRYGFLFVKDGVYLRDRVRLLSEFYVYAVCVARVEVRYCYMYGKW